MTNDIEGQLNAISEAARWQVALDLRDELAARLRTRGRATDGMDERVEATDRDSPEQVAELVAWLSDQLAAARKQPE